MIFLYSDGGSDNKGNSAAGCIIRIGKKKYCFSFYLGNGTNNEGEIFAALAGFSFYQYLRSNFNVLNDKTKIKWVGDSEYALKSGTLYVHTWIKNGWKTSQKDPVKNQGLWRTFLNITEGLELSIEHVRGHTGHLENEACDTAVTWARKNSELFTSGWQDKVVDIGIKDYPKWCMFDARQIIEDLRVHELSGIDKSNFIDSFEFDNVRELLTKD